HLVRTIAVADGISRNLLFQQATQRVKRSRLGQAIAIADARRHAGPLIVVVEQHGVVHQHAIEASIPQLLVGEVLTIHGEAGKAYSYSPGALDPVGLTRHGGGFTSGAPDTVHE